MAKSDAHTQLVKVVLAYLKAHGVPCWHSKTQGTYDPTTQRFRRFHGVKGVADVTAVLPGGFALFVECKTGNARTSNDQAAFREWVSEAGAWYVLAREEDWKEHLDPILAILK